MTQTGRELDDDRFVLALDSATPIGETARVRDASAGFLRVARLHWRTVAIIVAVTTLGAAFIAIALPRHYRATAIGVVAPLTGALTPSEAFHGVEALDRRSVVATVAALPSTTRLSPDYEISAAVLPNTNLVRVDVVAKRPDVAANVANATLNQLAAQTTSMFKYYDVTPVTRAVPPEAADSPRSGRIIAAGLVLGLLLATGFVYARSRSSVALA